MVGGQTLAARARPATPVAAWFPNRFGVRD